MTLADPILFTALSAGLLGGFGHCSGMCGPLVAGMSLAVSNEEPRHGLASLAFYNLGRILTYSLLGGLMGLVGSFLNVAGQLVHLQNLALYASGAFMILMGLDIAGISTLLPFLEKRAGAVTRLASRLGRPRSPLAFLPLGLALGLLPCGLSYTIMMAAAGTTSASKGALTLLVFGLGTLPAMTTVGAVALLFGGRMRGWLYRAGGVLVALSGIYFIFRGLISHANL